MPVTRWGFKLLLWDVAALNACCVNSVSDVAFVRSWSQSVKMGSNHSWLQLLLVLTLFHNSDAQSEYMLFWSSVFCDWNYHHNTICKSVSKSFFFWGNGEKLGIFCIISSNIYTNKHEGEKSTQIFFLFPFLHMITCLLRIRKRCNVSLKSVYIYIPRRWIN